jgi:Gpi18-like mannosyltransferase
MVNILIWFVYIQKKRGKKIPISFPTHFLNEQRGFQLLAPIPALIICLLFYIAVITWMSKIEVFYRFFPSIFILTSISLYSLVILGQYCLPYYKKHKLSLTFFDYSLIGLVIYYSWGISQLLQSNFFVSFLNLLIGQAIGSEYASLVDHSSRILISALVFYVFIILICIFGYIKRQNIIQLSLIKKKLISKKDANLQRIFSFSSDKKGHILFWVLIVGLFLTAIWVRYHFLPTVTNDLITISGWYDYIVSHNGFSALKDTAFSIYTPPYLYLFVIVSYFPVIPKIIAIKAISIIFDFICAYAIYKIAKKVSSQTTSWFLACLFLLNPVVWLNSAYWGQCDAIYTAFLLFAIYFLLNDNFPIAMVMFGIGFSFKLQSVFLLPFIFAILIVYFDRWKYLFFIPVTTFMMMIPAILAGKSIENVFSIYFTQTSAYKYLTMNAPSIFGFLNYQRSGTLNLIGIALALIISIFICWLMFRKKNNVNKKDIVLLASLSAFMLPFFLPQMHERYFYPASIISMLLLVYHPRLTIPVILINLTTYFSYFFFLWGYYPLSMPLLTVINSVVAIWFINYCYNYFSMKPNRITGMLV